jgi:hypothetical protein
MPEKDNSPNAVEGMKLGPVWNACLRAYVWLCGLVFWAAHPTLAPVGPSFRYPPTPTTNASLYNQPRLLRPRLLGQPSNKPPLLPHHQITPTSSVPRNNLASPRQQTLMSFDANKTIYWFHVLAKSRVSPLEQDTNDADQSKPVWRRSCLNCITLLDHLLSCTSVKLGLPP